MKKFFLIIAMVGALTVGAQTTNTALNAQIDAQITNATGIGSITKSVMGNNLKDIVAYIVQVITTVENRNVNGHALTGNVTVTKSDIGLSNVDNTSDANKPVSIAQAAALALKVGYKEFGYASSLNVYSPLAATINVVLDGHDGFTKYVTLPAVDDLQPGHEVIVIAEDQDVMLYGNQAQTTNLVLDNYVASANFVIIPAGRSVKCTYIEIAGRWKVEFLVGSLIKIDGNLPQSGQFTLNTYDSSSIDYTTSLLNDTFPGITVSDFQRIYQPMAPGGPKVYVRISGVWYRQDMEVVP